ncbi:GroES-like protein [Fomitopsis serialis]|uniref:GroES-like protein n=1 Tax=Fomitopsis serialis TaxID=139415 RepID=UPI0020083892|nr:GroES-like protein [Neoantrodia serialis]KAH9918101.1 GroES-like protein [Neoantrodia serialis]
MDGHTPIPATMKAVVVQKGKKAVVQDHPVPTLGDDDILVKVVAVAQNPADWRFVDVVQNAGTVLGCDWSGHVVQQGKNVTFPELGMHVAGFAMGGTYVDGGAYSEYVKTPAVLAWIVPEGTLSHEQAATVSVGLFTAVQCLYHPQRLALVEPPEKADGTEWVFVHGEVVPSVGQYTIQLARLSGYKVVTTASPKNFDLSADVVDAIKKVTENGVRYAVDTQSTKETQELCARCMGANGGKLILMFPPTFKAKKLRKDVEFIHTLLYTAFGRPFSLGPQAKYAVQPNDKAQIAAFMKKMPQLLRDDCIVTNRIKLWEGGLQAIPEGLQYMREGKVSAEKIVYHL